MLPKVSPSPPKLHPRTPRSLQTEPKGPPEEPNAIAADRGWSQKLEDSTNILIFWGGACKKLSFSRWVCSRCSVKTSRKLAESRGNRCRLLAKSIGFTAAPEKKNRFRAFQRMGPKNLQFRAWLRFRVSTPYRIGETYGQL